MCKNMATNLALDDEILSEALKIGGLKSKKDTVNQALKEFIQRRKAVDVIKRFGTIDFDPSYDYKTERHRK
jgi:Arc/MetJ family transcription regulator